MSIQRRTKTPEQIAAEYLAYYLNSKAVGEPVSILESITLAIEADRAQRRYDVVIDDGSGPRSLIVSLEPYESIVEAVMNRGDAAEEWTLIEVREA